MKTITIPKSFGYPTVDIVINNVKHTLKSGEEITIDDYIAEVIENAIALAPKQGRNKSRLAQLAEDGITEITAEDLAGISTIRNCAFYGSKNLATVIIPNGITRIMTSAFAWCPSLVNMYLPEKTPILENVNAFQNINTACIFYCKSQEILNAYKAAENWSTLTGTYTFKVEE